MSRYVVVGTGAIGGTMGGRLAQHEVPVVWVARGEHGRVLRDDGMVLRAPDGTFSVQAPVWLGPDDARLNVDDVLVIAVKTQQVQSALMEWVDVPVHDDGRVVGTAGECLPFLMCTNGVASEDVALRYAARVYGVCVWSPAAHLRPGEIIVRFAPESAVLHVGRYPAGLSGDADRRLLAAIAEDWSAAQLTVSLPGDVMEWKHRKLLTSLGNVVDALLGPDVDAGPVLEAVRCEARQVLEAAGVVVTDDATERAARRAGPRMMSVPGVGELGSSTWQSLVKGSPDLETDYLNGEIVRLAGRHGVPAPLNRRLAALGRQAVREGWAPGGLTAADLSARLGRTERLDS